MYKKAGIIVAAILVVAAIVIFVIASNASKPKTDGDSQTPVASAPTVSSSSSTPTASIPSVVAPVQSSTQASVQSSSTASQSSASIEPPASSSAVEQQPVIVNNSPLLEIDANDLPSSEQKTCPGTVVDRKCYAYNNGSGNQVMVSIIVNTTIYGQLEYFTTLDTYQAFKPGNSMDVSCDLIIFTSADGTIFPCIKSIKAI